MEVQWGAIQVTIKRVCTDFFWKGLRSFMHRYICECDTCQRVKGENISPIGLLQPLPILERNWTDISMDFIEGLSRSQGCEVILVVIDLLSKYAHFMCLAHPYTASFVD